jgi:hypothetical protein
MSMRENWTKYEMLADFEVLGFAYGMCVVKRKSDGAKGTLQFGTFEDDPVRYYYDFQEA